MTRHVTDEEVIDLALGEGAAAVREHVAACDGCTRRVAAALEGVALARRSEVPEPSPFYWESLRRGVRQRIAEEGSRRWRFHLLAPLAAAAAIVVLLFSVPASQRGGAVPPPLAAWSALPLADEDEGLVVLEGVALASGGLAEWDEARGLGELLAGLSDEESRALAETLRERAEGGES